MKKIFFLVIVFLFITINAYAVEYTLEDLYKLALERAESIKISEEDVFIAETTKDKAVAALLPKLSAFAGYTKYTEEKYASSGGQLIQPDNSKTWGFRLDQSFTINGRELKAFQITKENIEKSKYDYNALKENYLLSVSAAYYDVLRAKKTFEITKSNVERLTKYREAAAIRLRIGEITKTTLLRAEAELAGAKSEEIKARNFFELARAILARIVGITGPYELKETPFSFKSITEIKGMETINILKHTAFSERTELKSLEMQKKMNENQVSYAKGAYWPTISIEGVYSKKEDDPMASSVNKESVYGGVKLNFPFFEGGLRRAEVREAEARMRQAVLLYEDKKKAIGVEVENAYLDLQTQKGIMEQFEAQLAFATDNYNAVNKQFQYGIANSLDVMDANNLLVTAERQLADAKYNYQVAVLKLKKAAGILLKNIIVQADNKNN
ncbi:MAG: TolC family protein [Nitrospiraceae bacterium]|nr:TolC family protein [Nitrospiraceae bacterium]